MQCPRCGAENEDHYALCVRCSSVLHPPQTAVPPPPEADTPLGGLIPVKNQNALITYYLAVFSLIPCVGIFLGMAALVLGLRGLRFVQAHPEARGAVHAWIGILVGGFFGIGYLLLTLFVLARIVSAR